MSTADRMQTSAYQEIKTPGMTKNSQGPASRIPNLADSIDGDLPYLAYCGLILGNRQQMNGGSDDGVILIRPR
ncbi:MAG: hypothetical protein ACOZF0_08970 [Thermodesulfobacteriota bacterium]